MKTYRKLVDTNKNIENKDEKLKLNAYHSPSPMNELCDYICTWEKKNIMWSNSTEDLVDTRCLIVNNDLILNDRKIIKTIRRYINEYADEIRNHININGDVKKSSESKFNINEIINRYKRNILREINIDEETIANYVIKTSYSSISISKSLAWSAYGDYIIKNLKENSNPKRNISIVEVPYKTNDSYEYLGKYYEFRINYENKTQ